MKQLLLAAVAVAFVAGAVSGLAALPKALHGAGVAAPFTWEEEMFGPLEARR